MYLHPPTQKDNNLTTFLSIFVNNVIKKLIMHAAPIKNQKAAHGFSKIIIALSIIVNNKFFDGLLLIIIKVTGSRKENNTLYNIPVRIQYSSYILIKNSFI